MLPRRPETIEFLIDLLERFVTNEKGVASENRLIQEHAIGRLRKSLGPWLRGEFSWTPELPVAHVHWRLLESDGNSWGQVIDHYERIQHKRNEEFDVGRLRFIHDLKPDQIYIGLGSFEGYVTFIFKRAKAAVLDCPLVGNAVYVMNAGEWASLSQLSKTELLSKHRQEVKRIVHTGNWRFEVELAVKPRGHSVLA